MKLMSRDEKIVSFIKAVKCADAESLSKIYFNGSLRSAQKRLKILTDCGYINRWRKDHWSEYIYFHKNKPKQIEHNIHLSKLIAKLKEDGVEILKVKGSTKVGDVITDGIVAVKKDGFIKIYFIEIEKHYRIETIDKYKRLYKDDKWKDYGFRFPPSLIIICNKNIDTNNIPFELIVYKFSDI